MKDLHKFFALGIEFIDYVCYDKLLRLIFMFDWI